MIPNEQNETGIEKHMMVDKQQFESILASNDINEIKQIVQQMLKEDEAEIGEMGLQQSPVKPSFQDKLAKASGVSEEAQ